MCVVYKVNRQPLDVQVLQGSSKQTRIGQDVGVGKMICTKCDCMLLC